MGDVDHTGRSASPRYLLNRDRQLKRVASRTAVLLVDGQSEESELCYALDVFPRELFTFVVTSEVRVTRRSDGSDVIVQLNHPKAVEPNGNNGTNLAPGWDNEIDAAWSRRQRRQFSGQSAGADAAKVLGVPNLRASRFPSLDKLLDASPLLRTNWRRDGNAITKN